MQNNYQPADVPLETQVKREQNKVYRLRVQVRSADKLIHILQRKLMEGNSTVPDSGVRYNSLSLAYDRASRDLEEIKNQYAKLQDDFHELYRDGFEKYTAKMLGKDYDKLIPKVIHTNGVSK